MGFYQGVHGPDVSFYQDNPETPQQINFKKMKISADFVIIRAGQNKWVDSDFAYNYAEAKREGLPRGIYWFFDSRASPEEQADIALSLILSDPPELGIWLDLEENYNGSYKGWVNWKRFLNRLRTKFLPGIYTAPDYWMTNCPKTQVDLDFFGEFPLWIAHYGVLQPFIPKPWNESNTLFWQIGTPVLGIEYGAESLEIDMNYYNGDLKSFCSRFHLGTTPSNGGTMSQHIEGTVKGNVLIRTGPGTNYATALWNNADYLKAGTVIKAVYPNQAQWLKLTEINGVAVPETMTIYASAGTSQQYISWTVVTVQDDPPPFRIQYNRELGDGCQTGNGWEGLYRYRDRGGSGVDRAAMNMQISQRVTIVKKPVVSLPLARVVWDDENPDFGYKCRTQQSGWEGPDNPPAVMRYYPEMRDGAGDFRVNLSLPSWRPAILKVNGGDEQKFDYLTGPMRALYNKTGWPMQAYITMSGNYLEGVPVGDWFRFKTLKPEDVEAAMAMTVSTHPQYVHRFTCVTWDRETRTTKHIPSTGTPRGDVFYFLVTDEGFGYFPLRHVKF